MVDIQASYTCHNIFDTLNISPAFLQGILEVYIDKKMLPQMQAMNAVYRFAETSIKEFVDYVDPRDKIMVFFAKCGCG